MPLNLSHSGAATNPSLVVDSDGVTHVIWEDAFEHYVYARLEAGQWSAPRPTALHLRFGVPSSQATGRSDPQVSYTGPNPLFIAGPGRYTFALWITPQGSLYVGRVLNRDLANAAAWEAQLVSPAAAAFAADVDARGNLHVAYVRAADDPRNPAGIYYMRFRNNGRDRTAATLLYESPYLRAPAGGEANLDLVAAETLDALHVYLAWDNRPRKQVYLARSSDGGTSWEQPLEIAGPAPASGLAGPFNIRVGASGNNVALVWQSGQQDGACTQFFQSSADAGATWAEPQLMLQGQPGCARMNEFVTGAAAEAGGLLYLLTSIQSQVVLSIWNGAQWSDPEAQPILAGFEDPEIFTQVVYDCQRPVLAGERLYVVGCDRGGGGDIWFTSRALATITPRYSGSGWRLPAPVAGDDLEVAAIELVATEDNLIHAFFSRRRDPAIYYTRWDGAVWSRIAPVLRLPDGEAGWPAVAIGVRAELFLLARSSAGWLYFSQANSGAAVAASAWSPPVRLVAQEGTLGPAAVAWDAAGTIHVAYSVPVNDGRGIYLVQSIDRGATWSKPFKVFDGAAAGFDLVGPPTLLVSETGGLHVLWKKQSIQVDGASIPISLHYARSQDAGRTFSSAETVVEAPVGWYAIVADGGGNLHRLWRQPDMATTLWDQASFDAGRSWQVAQRLPTEGGAVAAAADANGRLQLVEAGPGRLGHWFWDGSRWQTEASFQWPAAPPGSGGVELAAAAVNREGQMLVVLAAPGDPAAGAESLLIYTTRALDQPAGPAPSRQMPTPSSPSPTSSAATPSAANVATPAAAADGVAAPLQGRLERASTPFTQGALALAPVAFLLLVVLGVVALRTLRAKGLLGARAARTSQPPPTNVVSGAYPGEE